MKRRVAVCALALLTLAPTPASAAAPSPTPSPSFSAPPSVDAATRELQRQQKALAAESARLATAALHATAALQAFQSAQRVAATARTTATIARQRSAAAKLVTTSARIRLLSYAGSLYRGGMVDPRLLLVTAALDSSTPRQFFDGLSLAAQVGNHRAQILGGLAQAQEQQATAARDADTALHAVLQSKTAAAAANTRALAAVAAYRTQVESRRTQVAQSGAVLQRAQHRQDNVDAATRLATAQGWRPTPPCAGRDLTAFPNGQLPLDGLCPVDFTHGQLLRADAAYAFNALAKEYAATFGLPICVTDAYRSLADQVTVKEDRGHFAATPGRSNHGWGLAVDLCGGVESFTSPAHQWLLDNAVLFGWFHPAWAEPSGVLPEAWHWEFAG